MRLLIIIPDENGNIVEASAHDVQNEATWRLDGGLLLEDGRLHIYPMSTLLFDLDPAILADVISWGRYGKYIIQNHELYQVVDWQPEIPPPEPPEIISSRSAARPKTRAARKAKKVATQHRTPKMRTEAINDLINAKTINELQNALLELFT